MESIGSHFWILKALLNIPKPVGIGSLHLGTLASYASLAWLCFFALGAQCAAPWHRIRVDPRRQEAKQKKQRRRQELTKTRKEVLQLEVPNKFTDLLRTRLSVNEYRIYMGWLGLTVKLAPTPPPSCTVHLDCLSSDRFFQGLASCSTSMVHDGHGMAIMISFMENLHAFAVDSACWPSASRKFTWPWPIGITRSFNTSQWMGALKITWRLPLVLRKICCLQPSSCRVTSMCSLKIASSCFNIVETIENSI